MIGKMLYIDPGTGSMLFSIIIGITGVLVFALRAAWIKLKFVFSGGRSKNTGVNNLPICIFSEGKRYWNVFQPICDEFEKREKELHYLTVSSDDPALSTNYNYVHPEFIGEGNKGLAKMNLLKADIVLSSTPSLDVFQWKRSKNVSYYVHIPHMPSDINMYKLFGLDFYDSVILSGQYQIDEIRRLEKSREEAPKETKLVGIPYLDKMKERLDKTGPVTDKKEPVILLAPSWGVNGILSIYGASFIENLVKTGYKVIIRPHPQSFTSEKEIIDDLMAKFPDSDKLQWNRDSDNFDVLNEADILISDFSGVIFDFTLVFNKPVIYTEPNYDKSQYDCAWDDVELWTMDILPKIGRELTKDNFEHIGDLVKECLSGSAAEDLAKGRDLAREQTWYDIGNGAKNVTDYLLAKHEKLTAPSHKKKA